MAPCVEQVSDSKAEHDNPGRNIKERVSRPGPRQPTHAWLAVTSPASSPPIHPSRPWKFSGNNTRRTAQPCVPAPPGR
jgi:hypothetical protein